MARQTGLVRYSGTMGGVRHFKIKGLEGDFAGLAGGPTAEQIATDPAFIRTRENMSEFGGCARVSKAIRVGLASIIRQMSDPYVAARLTALMKDVNLADITGTRGSRAIANSASPETLKGFNYDHTISLDGIFNAPFTLTNNVARNSATFTIPAFLPANYVNAPSGATHFRLLNAINVVSDYKFDALTKDYEPTDVSLNQLNDVQYSGYLDLSVLTALTTITTALPGAPTMTATVSVLNNIGIEFYQAIGSDYYLFAQNNALKVQDVF
jgi:hypothetical protein